MLLGNDQEMHWRLRPKVFECHHEVILMHKIRGCITSDNPAKKARLLHGCNLALLGLLLCTTLLAGARASQGPAQEPTQDPVKRIELLSYEGQKVSSVELAGQPDLNMNDVMPLVAQRSGD